MSQTERISYLNQEPARNGSFIVYWMQASQRTECNHALEYAISKANELNKPLIVLFGLTESFPEANRRHYSFMLQGLQEVEKSLEKRGIKFVFRLQSPELAAVDISANACMMVIDRGYLRIQRQWRQYVAERIDIPLIQVESDVMVPVEVASQKEDYSAATFRPRITKFIEQFLVPLKQINPSVSSLGVDIETVPISQIDSVISNMNVESAATSAHYHGGTREARRRLDRFIKKDLADYPRLANDPGADCRSHLSPYLHFGQISPLEIALRLRSVERAGRKEFLEELLIRRELAINFVFYNPEYDKIECLPDWAQKTLDKHTEDPRPYIYSTDEMEAALTHDPYWNAAQHEMLKTGSMHGYMRMYWGKKILEWSRTPDEAFRTALYLNNKYELDGRDPNGFAGIAWCFGKHDRPWQERPVFGKVRYMNENGLKRKFDIDKYDQKIRRLAG